VNDAELRNPHPGVTRSRLAVATVFFVNGAVLATWVPHIPAVKARHGLTDGGLGFVLLAMAGGSVLALPLAGWLVDRVGSRRMTTLAALGFCLLLPLPILSPGMPMLIAALALFGALNGALDVSMNTQALTVEGLHGRPIMSSFHGLFSLGGVAGAAVTGATMWLGDAQVVATALIGAAAVLASTAGLVAAVPTAHAPPLTLKVPRALVGLGALTFLGLLSEGAMGDWSAVYLRDELLTSPGLAAVGFAAFSLTMALGRFSGDRLVRRFGPVRVLQVSGATAAIGLGLALVIGRPVAAIVGFALVGLGIANVVPVLFSAAGQTRGLQAGTAIAAVATTGYLGFLAGPPAIGLVAEATGLPVALGLVSLSCGLIALWAAGALARRTVEDRPAALPDVTTR
jgi:MFS family permease